jgi:hypothetical protein
MPMRTSSIRAEGLHQRAPQRLSAAREFALDQPPDEGTTGVGLPPDRGVHLGRHAQHDMTAEFRPHLGFLFVGQTKRPRAGLPRDLRAAEKFV